LIKDKEMSRKNMTNQNVKRKLTAILSADVEGYSRLMDDDEVGTIRTLNTYKGAMTDLIRHYRGRVVDAPGDNLLAEFASVVDAVNCAVEIQRELAERNQELPSERRMQFRMGVNLGDVVEEEDRIYGDGVNIAARLESLAESGGICISGTVYDHIKNKVELEYEHMGEQTVKNISEPIVVYRVLSSPGAAAHRVINAKKVMGKKMRNAAFAISAVLVLGVAVFVIWSLYLQPAPSIEPASVEKMALPLPDKPSIAVLPFENLSGDPDQEYFSDGMTEQIITGLSVVPNLFVIARQSTFAYKGKPVKIQQIAEELGVRYVLEGSIQKSGDRIRLTAQLIDAIKGHHLWAARYDRNLKDIFELQDEVTMKIITELQVQLTEGEQARLRAKRTNNLQAYLKLMQGVKPLFTFTKEGNALARRIFKEVIALDPEFPQAYNLLGTTHRLDVLYGSSKSPPESLKKAEELIRKAIALDESYPEAHSQLGQLYLMKRQFEKAIAECRLAVDLSPNNARAHIFMGIVLMYAGNHEEAVRHSEKALRLNPNPAGYYFWILAATYIHAQRYEEAIAASKKALDRSPDDLFVHLTAAAAYSMAGLENEAAAEVEEVLRIKPKYSAQDMMNLPYKIDADKRFFISALRKAGLPENPPLELPDKPSIAVLPFDNLSDDPEQEYFSDGLAEEIITALSKVPKIFVIARNSSFTFKGKAVKVQTIGRELGVKYVLEGSVRKAGDRVRITAQLIDAINGHHLWAKRYDREFNDIFALQDEITDKILTSLQVKLTEGEQAGVWRKRTENINAYEKFIKGLEHFRLWTKDGNLLARRLWEEAIEIDPQYTAIYVSLAYTYSRASLWGWSKNPKASFQRAEELAKKALALDDSNPDTYALLGNLSLWKGQYDQAVSFGEKAVNLNPNGSDVAGLYALNLSAAGRQKEAIAWFKKSARLNPITPAWVLQYLGRAYILAGKYEDAMAVLKEILARNPEFLGGHIYLAAAYSLAGRDDDARTSTEEVLRIDPKFSLEGYSKLLGFKDEADKRLLMNAMRKAGLK
jgi:adenylate cyclase